jgi:catechol 2,3-dioxygenase-like lactoylglutathione lyase family enzyme
MRIYITSVLVDDQDKALRFYTDVLGFEKKTDIPVGEARWLTVVSPEAPDGPELLLEPDSHPAAGPYKVPDEVVRTDLPHHPEIWADLCGRYRLAARIADLRGRVAMGAGAQVFVRGGRLMVRVLTPLPALYRGLALHPDDEHDPYLFRLDLSKLGMSTARVAFAREAGAGATAMHTDLQLQSLYKQPATRRQAEAEAEA